MSSEVIHWFVSVIRSEIREALPVYVHPILFSNIGPFSFLVTVTDLQKLLDH